MSGGIEIETPGWEEVEVGVGFSEAAGMQPAEASSYIAPLAAVQVASEAQLQAALSAQEPEIEVTADFPITSTNTVQANYDVLIFSDEASPAVLSRGSSFLSEFFYVTDGGKLTLQNITLDGGGTAVAGVTGSLVEANDRGTIALNTGATLRNNVKTVGNGGGLNAIVDSTVYINEGAVIEDNKATYNDVSNGIGGGVYVSRTWPEGDTSKLYMSGGTIQRNECPNGGGGLALGSYTGEVHMTGGDIVYNAVTPDYLGGGVVTNGLFAFAGGSISHNTGTRGGGGVYISDGEFTMTDGTISENIATSGAGWGGGIWQGAAGYTQILGGSISGNESRYGGAIYHEYYAPYRAKTGIVVSGDAVISDNKASVTGGGIAVVMPDASPTNKRVIELSGNAIVTGNSGDNVGGVVVQAMNANHNADITFGGNVEVSGNAAAKQGGGMYLCGIDAEITDTFTVSGNTAVYGGGIRLMPASATLSTSLALKDSVSVSGNEAELGGGVCLSSNVSLAASDTVSINGNTGDLGAGVFLLGSEATVGGSATIDNNSASLVGGSTENNAAGGIYLAENSDGDAAVANLTGSATVTNNTAVKETGGIIVDEGGTLNVSGSVQVSGNALAGGSSGIAVYTGAELNVWGTPRIGTSDADNGAYLGSGTHAAVPAGENLLAGARVNFEGLEDGAAAGSLVAKRADGSEAAADEAALMAYTPGGFDVVRSASDVSEYVLEEAAPPVPAKSLSIARLYGADRFETSAKVSSYGRDVAQAQTVIVASGADRNFPDALSASALSGANGNAPIVLTDPAALPPTPGGCFRRRPRPRRCTSSATGTRCPAPSRRRSRRRFPVRASCASAARRARRPQSSCSRSSGPRRPRPPSSRAR